MNTFCLYDCCGGDKEEVNLCTDKNCPFFREKRNNLPWQNKRNHNKRMESQDDE